MDEASKKELSSEQTIVDPETGAYFQDLLSTQGELSICGNCGAFMGLMAESCSMCGVDKTVMIVREEIEVDPELGCLTLMEGGNPGEEEEWSNEELFEPDEWEEDF